MDDSNFEYYQRALAAYAYKYNVLTNKWRKRLEGCSCSDFQLITEFLCDLQVCPEHFVFCGEQIKRKEEPLQTYLEFEGQR